jgi:hypothetical protein
MPAVDPIRLRSQIGGLLELAERPTEFEKELADLLEAYADRRRSGEHVSIEEQGLRVNPVVIRTLKQEFQARFVECPEMSLALAQRIWDRIHRLARFFAPVIIRNCEANAVREIVEHWASETEDAEVHTELALSIAAAFPWRSDEDAFILSAERLVGSRSEGHFLLALKLLAEAVTDRRFESQHRVFRLIRGCSKNTAAAARDALIALCKRIALRTPAEVVKYLKAEFEAENDAARWLLVALERDLPARFGGDIAAILSTSGRTGIIRRKLVKD